MGNTPTWSPDTAIVGGVLEPSGNRSLPPGGTQTFTATEVSDTDRRTHPQTGVTYETDTVTRTWTCSGGSLTGDIHGPSVVWTAPAATGDYTVTLTLDDQGSMPPGEAGSRNDPARTVVRTMHVATATWAPGAPIVGGSITEPLSGLQVNKGQTVTCSAQAASDTDQRTAWDGSVTTPSDTLTYRWQCPQGSFSNGGWGLDVVWTAPNTGGTFTLTLVIDDVGSVTAGEGGTRQDPVRTLTTQVLLKAPTWDPYTEISGASLVTPANNQTVDPGATLVCAAGLASDVDRRTAEDGSVTTAADTCTYTWQATGGAFSPASGQNVTWHAPSVSGLYTLTLRVDDQASIPSGDIGIRNDPDHTFTIQVRVRHVHQWASINDISPATFTVSERYPVRGERIELDPDGNGSDTDQCLAANCFFVGGQAPNATRKHRWTANGGRFVYEQNGNWITSNDPGLVTHWEAPNTSGPVTLVLETEDTPQATDPETNSSITTYDDGTGLHTVEVRVVTHRHTWEAGDPLSATEPYVSERFPVRGEYVQITVGAGQERDRCPLPSCVFPGGYANNAVRAILWRAVNDNGQSVGEFGFFDGGTWVRSGDPEEITHWQAPPRKQPTPEDPYPYDDWYGPMGVTLQAKLDDDPTAYDSERGENIATYDDPWAYAETRITVVRHKHTWETAHNVPAEVTVDNETPMAGDLVRLGGGYMGSAGMDMDRCTGSDCSLPGGWAYNNTHVVQWAARNSSQQDVGTLGRLDGMGQFIPWQAGESPGSITHWKAPSSGIPAGGLSVTLRVWMDDGPPEPPMVWDAEVNQEVPSFDDNVNAGAKTITVTGPAVWVSVEKDDICAGAAENEPSRTRVDVWGPAEGIQVSLSVSGGKHLVGPSLAQATLTTDATGRASTWLTSGDLVGEVIVTAQASGGPAASDAVAQEAPVIEFTPIDSGTGIPVLDEIVADPLKPIELVTNLAYWGNSTTEPVEGHGLNWKYRFWEEGVDPNTQSPTYEGAAHSLFGQITPTASETDDEGDQQPIVDYLPGETPGTLELICTNLDVWQETNQPNGQLVLAQLRATRRLPVIAPWPSIYRNVHSVGHAAIGSHTRKIPIAFTLLHQVTPPAPAENKPYNWPPYTRTRLVAKAGRYDSATSKFVSDSAYGTIDLQAATNPDANGQILITFTPPIKPLPPPARQDLRFQPESAFIWLETMNGVLIIYEEIKLWSPLTTDEFDTPFEGTWGYSAPCIHYKNGLPTVAKAGATDIPTQDIREAFQSQLNIWDSNEFAVNGQNRHYRFVEVANPATALRKGFVPVADYPIIHEDNQRAWDPIAGGLAHAQTEADAYNEIHYYLERLRPVPKFTPFDGLSGRVLSDANAYRTFEASQSIESIKLISLHEIGHILKLNHTADGQAQASVMLNGRGAFDLKARNFAWYVNGTVKPSGRDRHRILHSVYPTPNQYQNCTHQVQQ